MTKKTTKEFLENISSLNNLNLSFGEILSTTKSYITVKLQGRCLNGSYVYEDEQVASYLRELRKAFPGTVSYVGGDNVYSWGRYIFKFENKSWTEQGKVYSANGYEAFAIGYGEPWAAMYRIYKNTFYFKDEYKLVGLEILSNDVYLDGEKIFKCLEFTCDTHHHFKGHNTDCNRTLFNASFECYKKESEIEEIYIKINKRVLEHNIKVQEHTHTVTDIYYQTNRNVSPTIEYRCSDDSYSGSFRYGDTLLKPLIEKTVFNRDLTTQNFKIGDTFTNKEGYVATITNISYDIKKGFNYSTYYKTGDSNVYSSIDQIDLLKLKSPTVNVNPPLMELIGSKVMRYDRVQRNGYDGYRGYEDTTELKLNTYKINSFYIGSDSFRTNFGYLDDIMDISLKSKSMLESRLKYFYDGIKKSAEVLISSNQMIKEFNSTLSNQKFTYLERKVNDMKKDIEKNIKLSKDNIKFGNKQLKEIKSSLKDIENTITLANEIKIKNTLEA